MDGSTKFKRNQLTSERSRPSTQGSNAGILHMLTAYKRSSGSTHLVTNAVKDPSVAYRAAQQVCNNILKKHPNIPEELLFNMTIPEVQIA